MHAVLEQLAHPDAGRLDLGMGQVLAQFRGKPAGPAARKAVGQPLLRGHLYETAIVFIAAGPVCAPRVPGSPSTSAPAQA